MNFKKLQNNRGISLLEVLIAMLMTGILAAAAFQFYAKMHNSTLTQAEISDMQQSSRSSLDQICRTLKMAGYKLDDTLPAYEINGESLYVFASISKPVDTILFFLQNCTQGELQMANAPDANLWPRKLMIQENNDTARVFADNIRAIRFRPVGDNSVLVSLTTQTMRPDVELANNNGGYHFFTAADRIKLRNAGI